jgi:hypothetical protein
MRYVTYNPSGKLTGAFDQDLRPEHANNHIEVLDPVFAAWPAYRANAGSTGVELIPVVPPAPVVPQEVTMRQARLALLGAGNLSTINAAIAGMTGTAGDAARIEWDYSSSVKRTQPLVLQMGAALGLTSAQLDQLFITAAAL